MDQQLMEKCQKTADIYAKATGLETKFINGEGLTLYEAKCDSCEESLCSKVSKQACRASHLFGAQQSLIFGNIYVFFCPIGLVHFVSPIIVEGQMMGALISGQLLMTEPDVYLIRHIMKNVTDVETIKDFVEKVEVISPQQVNALAELLKLVVSNLSDGSKSTELIVDKDEVSQARHQHSINKVINYIRCNYMTKITLEEMAEQVYFTPPYLSKIFKEETGYNFKHYLCLVRIEFCKKLLCQEDLSHTEIAYMTGFADQSHFSKSFKKITGMSPKVYRLNHSVY